MINGLGEEIRNDSDRRYVQIPAFEDHVRKNDDEHKDMQSDINHVCIRLKLLEEFKAEKEQHDAKQDAALAHVEKLTKKHDKAIEDIIFQLSQMGSRPSEPLTAAPISVPDSGDILSKVNDLIN